MDIVSLIDKLYGHKDKTLDVIMAKNGDELLERFTRVCNSMTNAHAMTITFTDNILFAHTERYLMCEASKMLKSTRGVNKYMFINDLSVNGRFHLHGMVEFKNLNIIKTLRRKFNKFGMTKVKYMDNIPKWVGYCTQQYTEEGKKGIKMSKELVRTIG